MTRKEDFQKATKHHHKQKLRGSRHLPIDHEQVTTAKKNTSRSAECAHLSPTFPSTTFPPGTPSTLCLDEHRPDILLGQPHTQTSARKLSDRGIKEEGQIERMEPGNVFHRHISSHRINVHPNDCVTE